MLGKKSTITPPTLNLKRKKKGYINAGTEIKFLKSTYQHKTKNYTHREYDSVGNEISCQGRSPLISAKKSERRQW